MALALKASTTSGGKVEYTNEEKNLAAQILACLLPLADQAIKKTVEIDPEIDLLCTDIATNGGHTGLDTMARDCFRTHIRNICIEGDKFTGTSSFPKMRDPTSVQLIMRNGLEMVGREDLKDALFARYGAKKTA